MILLLHAGHDLAGMLELVSLLKAGHEVGLHHLPNTCNGWLLYIRLQKNLNPYPTLILNCHLNLRILFECFCTSFATYCSTLFSIKGFFIDMELKQEDLG